MNMEQNLSTSKKSMLMVQQLTQFL